MGVVKITKMQKPKYTYFFNKQPGYRQLALKWQIAKQLSGLNSLSVSNNKNCRLKKSRVFPLCNKYKTAVRPTIHHNSAASKALLEKFQFVSSQLPVYIFAIIT